MGLIILNIIILSIYLVFPGWIACVYSLLLKSRFKVKTIYVMLGALFLELLLVGYLYFNPIITYSPEISQSEVEQVMKFINEVDLEVDDIFGFDQKQLPVFVFRYNFEYAYDSYNNRTVALHVNGFPIGYERYYPEYDSKKLSK